MRETILAISILVLPALYLSGYFFAVRLVLRSTETTVKKGVFIAGLTGMLVLISLVSLGVLLMAAGGYNH